METLFTETEPVAETQPEIDLWNEHAREKLNMPEDWHWYRISAQPEGGRKIEDFTHTLIRGAVCTARFTKGPRKGQRNWRSLDVSTERSVLIGNAEHQQWVREWEQKTGKCSACTGTARAWNGWSKEDGQRYVPCRRCNATGKAPEQPNAE